jgi:hypothetical protein
MEITGTKWTLKGAEAILRMRALRANKNFDAYWTFYEECEYKRNHQTHYANGAVPSVTASKVSAMSSRFKIIK